MSVGNRQGVQHSLLEGCSTYRWANQESGISHEHSEGWAPNH